MDTEPTVDDEQMVDLELEFTDAEMEKLQRAADAKGCTVEELILTFLREHIK